MLSHTSVVLLMLFYYVFFFFFFQAEDGIRDLTVTGVQTCALPISILITRSPIRDSPTPTMCRARLDSYLPLRLGKRQRPRRRKPLPSTTPWRPRIRR